MWCVFHNAQWYWSDNLCKLVTDQWQGSLGVHDSESCWFTEEIGTYMRCWESLGDLPLVIEICISFRSFRCAPLAKRHKISITHGRSPSLFLNKAYWLLYCRMIQMEESWVVELEIQMYNVHVQTVNKSIHTLLTFSMYYKTMLKLYSITTFNSTCILC
jgi:hypothetical protein